MVNKHDVPTVHHFKILELSLSLSGACHEDVAASTSRLVAMPVYP